MQQADSGFTFAPEVMQLLDTKTPRGELARSWLRYARGLVGEGGVRLEDVVDPDVRCSELLAAGLPPGLAGLRAFRAQINAAFPDERTHVTVMRFSGADVVETELHCTATHRGSLMGVAPTGRAVTFFIQTLNRFRDGRMVERWDRMDFEGLLRQLRGA